MRNQLLPVSEPVRASKLHEDDVVPGLPESENKRFYPALDGLRAVAVLMVFYNHYLSHWPSLNWGWLGVDIFFVLSGFLITGILYDTRNTLHRFRNFYVRRTLRIFPLYYGVLLIGLVLTPVFHWVWHPVWILWPLYLGNYGRFIWLNDWMQGTGVLDHLRSSLPFRNPFFLFFGHFWSLCVEEQFYLVWPLLVFAIKDRARLRNLCLAVCVLGLGLRIACVFLMPQDYLTADFLYRITPLRADALLMGGALALMLRGPEAARLYRIKPLALGFFVAAGALAEIIYRFTAHHFYHPVPGAPVMDTVGYTLIDLFAGLVILLSLNPNGVLYRILTIRPLRRLGQISYGFYVFHDIPHIAYIALAERFTTRTHWVTPLAAVIALPGTLLLSYLSYRFFEAPFLRLKDRYTI
jgi:peptidoglycan/LPS O-acetylase OafA/YrhL